MLCQNCGKNEVTFHYTQIVNGVKKEMALCDKCARELGLDSLDFNMPIDVSSFLGDFLSNPLETLSLSSFAKTGTLKCDKCGMTHNEFLDTGKMGCDNCYDIFSVGLDNLLKNIQGSAKHIGRIGTGNHVQKTKQTVSSQKNEDKNRKEVKIEKLNKELNLAIKDERYEDAAKIRDEINAINKKQK